VPDGRSGRLSGFGWLTAFIGAANGHPLIFIHYSGIEYDLKG